MRADYCLQTPIYFLSKGLKRMDWSLCGLDQTSSPLAATKQHRSHHDRSGFFSLRTSSSNHHRATTASSTPVFHHRCGCLPRRCSAAEKEISDRLSPVENRSDFARKRKRTSPSRARQGGAEPLQRASQKNDK